MDINAQSIYSKFVAFAKEELARVNGDLKKADAMASFSGRDVSQPQVTKSKDFYGNVFRFLNSGLCEANKNTRREFFGAIRSMLDKSANTELLQHIKDQINIEENSTKPLSARRIILISREVELALLDTEAGRLPEVNTLKENVLQSVVTFSGQNDVNAFPLAEVAKKFKSAVDALLQKSEDFADVQEQVRTSLTNGVNAILDEVADRDTASAGDFRGFHARLRAFCGQAETELGNLNLQPGTRMRSAMFGALHVLKDAVAALSADDGLLDEPEIRVLAGRMDEKVLTLRAAGSDVAKGLADELETQYKAEGGLRADLTKTGLDGLLRKADEDIAFAKNYGDVCKEIGEHVKGAVESFRQKVLKGFEGDPGLKDVLFISQEDETKFVNESVDKCTQQALTAMKEGRTVKYLSSAAIQDAYAKLCSVHAKDVFKARLEGIAGRINDMTLKMADEDFAADIFKTTNDMRKFETELKTYERQLQLCRLQKSASDTEEKLNGIKAKLLELSENKAKEADKDPILNVSRQVCNLLKALSGKTVKITDDKIAILSKQVDSLRSQLEKSQKQTSDVLLESRALLNDAKEYVTLMNASTSWYWSDGEQKRANAADLASMCLKRIEDKIQDFEKKLNEREQSVLPGVLGAIKVMSEQKTTVGTELQSLRNQAQVLIDEGVKSYGDVNECERTVSDLKARVGEFKRKLQKLDELKTSPERGKNYAKQVRASFERNRNLVLIRLDSAAEVDLPSVGRALKALENRFSWTNEQIAEIKKNDAPVERPKGYSRAIEIKSRFGLDEPEVLAGHVLRRRQDVFRTILEKVDDQGVRKGLLERFDALFDETNELPKALVDLAVMQCRGATDVNAASSRIRKFFVSYFKCLAHKASQPGATVAYDENGIPSITEKEVSEFVGERSKHEDFLDSEVSAFGHGGVLAKIDRLLNEMSSDGGAKALRGRLAEVVAQFKAPKDMSEFGGTAYQSNYLDIYRDELKKPLVENGEKTRRERLEELLGQLEDIEDVGDPEDRALVISTCNEFCEIAAPLPDSVRMTARQKTFDDMDPKARFLRKIHDRPRSLDEAAIVKTFTDAMRIDEATYRSLSLDDVMFATTFLSEAWRERLPSLDYVRPLLDEVLTDSIPRSLFEQNKDMVKIVMDLVSIKARLDHGDTKPDYDRRWSGGFGTYSAKEIVCALAGDGLAGLSYVAPGGETRAGRPATEKLLSFLWELNDQRLGGLPEVCMRVFGKPVDEVTLEDFKKVDDKMIANRKNNLTGMTGLDPLKTLMADKGKTADRNLQTVMKMLSGDLTSGLSAWDDKPDLTTVKGWADAFKNLQGGSLPSATLTMNGRKIRFTKTSAGFLSANVLDPKTDAPTGIHQRVSLTPVAFAADCLRQLLAATVANKELVKFLSGGEAAATGLLNQRDVAIEIIRRFKPDVKAVTYSQVKTSELERQALELLDPKSNNKLEKAADKTVVEQVNSQGVLELIDKMEAAAKAGTVIDDVIRLPKSETKPPADPAQAALRDFVADILAFGKSWKADRLPDFRARMRLALTENPSEAGKLLALDAKGMEKLLEPLGLTNLSKELVNLFVAVKERLGGGEVTGDSLGVAFDKVSPPRSDVLSGDIKKAVSQDMEVLQDVFKAEFVDKLLSSGAKSVELQSLREIAGTETIDKENGYGRFLTEVMSGYFAEMGDMDKLGMLANVIRNTTNDSSPMARITALVKGAGPVFLKLVQGIPEGAVPKDEKEMLMLLGDVKDALPPIPDEVIRAQLYDMVAQSKDAIIGIDVVESLGAASVGQALLCRVRTQYNPDGEECVIKLLRPNVQNFAQRERDFIQRKMNDVQGMKQTFAGRLDGIMDEMDLTKEALNVQFGRVYAHGSSCVDSMELHPIIRPTELSMVVKKAPGLTCKKYFKSVEARTDALLDPLVRDVVTDDGRKVKRYYARSYSDFCATRDGLLKLHDELRSRQDTLLALTRRWADECLFGAGFFHGDLHAGNIMIDENVATFIDYGNAVKLTKTERDQLIKMLATCGYGDASNFLGELKKLLPGHKLGLTKLNVKGEAVRDSESEDRLEKDLVATFAKGSMNDSGLRIAAAVNLLQRYGVAVPATLYNFSQSMLRLQAAVDLGNETLQRLQTAFEELQMDPAVLAEEKVSVKVKDDLGSEHSEEIDYFDPFESFLNVIYENRTSSVLIDKFAADALKCRCDSEDPKKPNIIRTRPRKTEENPVVAGSVYWTLLEMCDNRESVKTRLLPLLKRHVSYYKANLKSTAVPELRDREGYRAYRLALEMAEGDFDFSDTEAVKDRVKKIGGLIEKRVFGTASNMFDQAHVTFEPLCTFSNVFEECLCDNVGTIESLMYGYMFHLGDIKKANKAADKENAALKEIHGLVRGFLAEHQSFSPMLAHKVVGAMETGFIFVPGLFGANWGKGLAKGASGLPSKEPCARLLLSNIGRVKSLLAAEGYKKEDDPEGKTMKEAVRLAFTLFAVKNDLFTAFAALEPKQLGGWTATFKNLAALDGNGMISHEDAELLRETCEFLAGTDKGKLNTVPVADQKNGSICYLDHKFKETYRNGNQYVLY